MSREHRSGYYGRDRDRDRDRDRERDREWNRGDYRRPVRKRSRSRSRNDLDKRRSRTPRKTEKDLIDDNILSEISKLPEPSELWDNQFQDNNFSAPPPPSFPQERVQNSEYSSSYQSQYSGMYDEFNNVMPPQHPPEMAAWNQMSLPPPLQAPQAPPAPVLNSEDQIKKDAAIESEMRQQKAALCKQREDYIKKAGILKKELDTLKDQRNELRGDAKRSPSPDTKRFLRENTKLQLEIQNKMKTINNVVDMLNGIIGEEVAVEIPDSDESQERSSKRKSRSPAGKKFNLVYYDPEMHWCRVCNEFPPTAKDYLNHLHSPAHQKMAAAHMEAPWHSVTGVNEGFHNYPNAPTKRTPIRGLQFFVPSTAWYCKLCDQFIGDLHCASAHLKSVVHSKNYTNFVEQNPHWETDWMSDRQKAVEKTRAKTKTNQEDKQQYTSHTITFHKDGFHTKNKNSPSRTPDEKKKKNKKRKNKRKRSSSNSSSSSSSDDSQPKKKKKNREESVSKKEKRKTDTPDDKSLTEWVSNIKMDRLNDNDRKLIDTIKHRIKKDKHEEDKRRSPSSRSSRERSAGDGQRRQRENERHAPNEDRRREERRDDLRRDDRRDDRREDRRDDRREDRRDERRNDRQSMGAKKPEIKKMPFIGKMPVYKHLGKPKIEDQKKEETKKKEDEAVTKKRREEMDAEIQKKVAEFKEKIAKAQLERQQQLEMQALVLPQAFLPPPLLPPTHPQHPPHAPPQHTIPAPAPQPAQPNLSKDFQDALDIIFPTGEVKNPELAGQDMFAAMPPGFPLAGVMPPFQPLGIMQPQMFGFDMNGQLFPPRPQLYDAHVPIVSSPNPRQQNNKNSRPKDKETPEKNVAPKMVENGKNKEELDDLAMLGIDASDVGAGI